MWKEDERREKKGLLGLGDDEREETRNEGRDEGRGNGACGKMTEDRRKIR